MRLSDLPGAHPSELTDTDREIITAHLGRTPRGAVAVAARCRCGTPLAVITAPRLPDGSPFPTTYYLTHPEAVAAVSVPEAAGWMASVQAELAQDDDLRAGYEAAHRAYLADRDKLATLLDLQVPEISGISAGGMPTRVKCLHALVAHSLAAGPGVNPVGDRTLDLIAERWRPDRCACLPLAQ